MADRPTLRQPRRAALAALQKPIAVSLPNETPAWVADEITGIAFLSRSEMLIKLCHSPLHFPAKTWDAIGDIERARRVRNPPAVEQPTQPLLAPFANLLHRAVTGYNAEKRLTKGERREIASEIRKAAIRLSKAVRRFNDFDEYPDWQYAVLRTSGASLKELVSKDSIEMPPEPELGSWIAGALRALQYPDITLRTVLASADLWSRPTELNLHRPTEKTAARTFFIKSIGMSFERRYGDSHPEIIDCLVAALFDSSDNPLTKQGVEQRLTGRIRSSKRAGTNRKKT